MYLIYHVLHRSSLIGASRLTLCIIINILCRCWHKADLYNFSQTAVVACKLFVKMNNIVGILAVLLAAFSVLQVEGNYRCVHDYGGPALQPPPHPITGHFSQDPVAAVATRVLEPFTSTYASHSHVKGPCSLLQLLPFPVEPLNIARPFTPLQHSPSHPSLFGPLFSLL